MLSYHFILFFSVQKILAYKFVHLLFSIVAENKCKHVTNFLNHISEVLSELYVSELS